VTIVTTASSKLPPKVAKIGENNNEKGAAAVSMERMRETQRHTPFKGEMMKNYRRYVEAMYIWDTAVATIASVPITVKTSRNPTQDVWLI